MKTLLRISPLLVMLALASCSKKIIAERPLLANSRFNLDSIPDSEINIPIRINLRPLYALAESQVDTLFTSPDYPNGWVYQGCDTRYQYRFRRGPLQLKAVGNRFDLGFTGYYRISGSSRVCVAGTAISSWSAPCRCGYNEPERRVNISFSNRISLQSDYKVRLQVQRNEPEALDKCEVCFWGQDITNQVLSGLVEELDSAKVQLEREYGLLDLRPRFQQVWNELSRSFDLYGRGWLQVNPTQLQINNLFAKNDSLYIYLGLKAKPRLSFEKPVDYTAPLPPMGAIGRMDGFNVFVDAELNYDSLSRIVNSQVAGRSFDFKKGPIHKKFIIDQCALYGSGNERLIIRVDFSGTNKGTLYLTGKPAYDPDNRILDIRDMEFDIKTKNLLLGSADWLFNRRILNEISRQARFDLGEYVDSAKTLINAQMNREWYPGLRSEGAVNDIRISGIYPFPGALHIRSRANGVLAVKLDELNISL
jgi:hypothetical protein